MPTRHDPHGFGKAHVLNLAHKTENIARGLAAKAVEKLLPACTLKPGVFSLWNGHSPVNRCAPALRSRM